MLTGIVLWAAVAAIATAAIWKASDWLETTSANLATYYGLPDAVQGAIIVAIGSSFPEISSIVLATLLHGSFDLGVSSIIGSAIFNVLAIPALAGIFGSGISSNKAIAYKEALFYMLAVSVLALTLGLSVVYFPTETPRLGGEVTPVLALLPLTAYAVYVFTQYQDTQDHTEQASLPSSISILRQWGYLALSLLVIGVAVEGLVRAAIAYGAIFDTPSFLWGLTIVAAGTSLPDSIVSIRMAKKGEGVTSLANVFGSNTFDLLAAVPLGVLLAGGAVVNFGAALPMFVALAFATLLTFTFTRTDLVVSKREAYVLLAAYILFIVWVILETFSVISLIPTA